MFELLFKYPPAAFAHGQLVLLGTAPVWVLGALLLVAGLGLALLTQAQRGARAPGVRGLRLAVLWTLQCAVLGVLLLLLWRPALAVSELQPRQNIVAVLVDESRSMSIVEDGAARAVRAVRALRSGVLAALQRRFQTRLYRVDGSVRRVADLEQLGPPDGAATHLGGALAQLESESADLPLGAVVLLSDGADTAGGIDPALLEALRARRIPVHTVGLGAEQLSQDVELVDVSVAAQTLAGSRLAASVKLRQQGFAGRHVRLSVRAGPQLLGSRDVELAADGVIQSESVLFNAGAAGPKSLEFALETLPGERNRANNAQRRALYVRPEPRRVLYFEGEPRWEYKFIRRAADDDPMLHLASILRISENKLYRQGIADASELASGFPSRAEELFAYQGLIIGSVDAGYFTPAQQRLIRDFVDRRGGGLLLLGGREALADGVWSGSLVADALPVRLPGSGGTFHRDPATVSLTAAGEQSVICRLLDDASANAARWSRLPYLMDYQDPGTPKAGALVLAQMRAGARTLPLLVTARYGEGRTAVLATGGTWRWQMSLPLGDHSHDLFWQQLLRWLAGASPGPVVGRLSRSQLNDDGHLRLAAEVRDRDYRPAPDALVSARITGPGTDRTLELRPAADEPGQFQAEWAAPAPGMYVAEITARRGSQDLGRDSGVFERLDGVAENFHTEQNRALLTELAQATGGRYWSLGQLAALPASIPYSQAGISVQQTLELWNMPAIFALLLLLKGAEWLLRRRWGIV
ncbi:MAG TPA: glutamine amidotransferase [Steroidobacteraceae bacterium]|nr:glutamine amidotransferase [Steroidobacteraceae bacterium]